MDSISTYFIFNPKNTKTKSYSIEFVTMVPQEGMETSGIQTYGIIPSKKKLFMYFHKNGYEE